MRLAPQTRLVPYEILAALGAGGMGEVYRARDTKLGREVALKVLPEAFASDPQRMARFEREARVLASLNHPNIASIHGLEESGSTRALVMELVEGPTLAERARSGPLPVDEALRTACQIAEALEAAHEKGIIHRDLKPANVKVTPAGAIKVLDFGLAKAMEDPVASDNAPDSPTLTAAATQADTIMGTPAYMAPEQARGQAVDKRADIWAFGAVLFEMLTGQHAFAGETTSDVLDSGAEVRPRLERGARLDAAVRRQAAAPLPHQRSQATPAGIPPPPGTALRASGLDMGPVVVSPDAKTLAFTAVDDQGITKLWLRPLDAQRATPLAGMEDATYPFWSFDGQYLAFIADGKLEKISVSGGDAQTLAEGLGTETGRGTWSWMGRSYSAKICLARSIE